VIQIQIFYVAQKSQIIGGKAITIQKF
jgi:hypothetical protein